LGEVSFVISILHDVCLCVSQSVKTVSQYVKFGGELW
jgi:hypothetical protein